MKKWFAILVATLPLMITACRDTTMQYKKSQVEILSVSTTANKTTVIAYRPMLDSLYFCAGANLQQQGDRTKIAFVRCKISESCKPDLVAEKLAQGEMKISISSPVDKIDLVFSDGETTLP